MLGSTIVVLTSHRQTRRQIARALHSGGINVHFTDNQEEMASLLVDVKPELAIIDCNGELSSVEGALAAFNNESEHPPLVILSMGSDVNKLLHLVKNHEVGNLVAKHGAIRAVYPMLDERELLVTCEKVLRRNIFGIDKYVGSWGVVLHRAVITGTADKTPFLVQFENFLNELDCPASIVQGIVTVAEELILNAVVHAPHYPDGKSKYEHLGPLAELTLEPDEHVNVVYGCDGTRLMFSVTDNFGRLSRETLYKYLTRSFDMLQSPETKVSGAGLGLSLAFRSIHQFVFNVQENARTEVIAGWYLRIGSASEFRQVAKSVNLFWLPGPDKRERSSDGTIVVLKGRIDETTNFDDARTATKLDLRGVTGIGSRGLLQWLRFIHSMNGRKLEMIACPEVLVRAATEIAGVLEGTIVKSFLVPFECIACSKDAYAERTPEAVFQPPTERCQECGQPLQFAGIPEQYESVLSRNT